MKLRGKHLQVSLKKSIKGKALKQDTSDELILKIKMICFFVSEKEMGLGVIRGTFLSMLHPFMI